MGYRLFSLGLYWISCVQKSWAVHALSESVIGKGQQTFSQLVLANSLMYALTLAYLL